MPFSPNSSLFRKNNTRNIKHMAVLIFHKMPRFERKYLFSDRLLVFLDGLSCQTGQRLLVSDSICKFNNDF